MMDLDRVEGLVREAGGAELWERLTALETRTLGPSPQVELQSPGAQDRPDFDVVIAGGGLSLLLAPALARRGLRVAILDRATVGRAHREWNASRPELEPLIAEEILGPDQLEELMVARYAFGVCRWFEGGSYPVRGVLDVAVEAQGLLSAARRAAEARGVQVWDHTTLRSTAWGPGGIRMALDAEGRSRTVTARLLVEARGAAQAGEQADLVCPTVGGVLSGLARGSDADCLDPEVGDILATTEHVEDGRQHVWESFPGRAGQATVYLFYYADRGDLPDRALSRLYARFFETRPRFKRGEAKLVRPTFGFIPGWSRLRPAPRPPTPRVVLFGDAAARHSPLTYCGFGHLLRTLGPSADAIAALLEGPPARLERPIPALLDDAPIHRGTGALSRLMSRPTADPRSLNRLLDAAFKTLHDRGEAQYRALLQDRLPIPQFMGFLSQTAAQHPAVYREVMRGLGPWATARWGGRLAWDLVRAPGAEVAA
ncbi:MAG: lycopene cyclase [Myxococcota bacterium]